MAMTWSAKGTRNTNIQKKKKEKKIRPWHQISPLPSSSSTPYLQFGSPALKFTLSLRTLSLFMSTCIFSVVSSQERISRARVIEYMESMMQHERSTGGFFFLTAADIRDACSNKSTCRRDSVSCLGKRHAAHMHSFPGWEIESDMSPKFFTHIRTWY